MGTRQKTANGPLTARMNRHGSRGGERIENFRSAGVQKGNIMTPKAQESMNHGSDLLPAPVQVQKRYISRINPNADLRQVTLRRFMPDFWATAGDALRYED